MKITQLTTGTSTPRWAADYGDRSSLLPGGVKLDASQFPTQTQTSVTLTANAAQNATTLAVQALTNPITAGRLLSFGVGKFAKLTANAATGATSLSVEALPTALVNGDTAVHLGTSTVKFVASGTLLGKKFNETSYGPAVADDDQIGFLWIDVADASVNNDAELYVHGRVKLNFLPVLLSTALLNATKVQFYFQEGK